MKFGIELNDIQYQALVKLRNSVHGLTREQLGLSLVDTLRLAVRFIDGKRGVNTYEITSEGLAAIEAYELTHNLQPVRGEIDQWAHVATALLEQRDAARRQRDNLREQLRLIQQPQPEPLQTDVMLNEDPHIELTPTTPASVDAFLFEGLKAAAEHDASTVDQSHGLCGIAPNLSPREIELSQQQQATIDAMLAEKNARISELETERDTLKYENGVLETRVKQQEIRLHLALDREEEEHHRYLKATIQGHKIQQERDSLRALLYEAKQVCAPFVDALDDFDVQATRFRGVDRLGVEYSEDVFDVILLPKDSDGGENPLTVKHLRAIAEFIRKLDVSKGQGDAD